MTTKTHTHLEWDNGRLCTRVTRHADGRRVLEYFDYEQRVPHASGVDLENPVELARARTVLAGIDEQLDCYLAELD